MHAVTVQLHHVSNNMSSMQMFLGKFSLGTAAFQLSAYTTAIILIHTTVCMHVLVYGALNRRQ
jgi:hypothetical protein